MTRRVPGSSSGGARRLVDVARHVVHAGVVAQFQPAPHPGCHRRQVDVTDTDRIETEFLRPALELLRQIRRQVGGTVVGSCHTLIVTALIVTALPIVT